MTRVCCTSWLGLGSRILFVIARYEAIANYVSLLCKFALYSHAIASYLTIFYITIFSSDFTDFPTFGLPSTLMQFNDIVNSEF